MWLPPTSTYTADDLLRIGRSGGFNPTRRLITDWSGIGLLDHPERSGRGRGKGVGRTWSYNQLRLWLVLLDKRREVTHVAALCNVPVFLWLYFGPEYAPVRQVRKALGFFNRRFPNATVSDARKGAKRIVEQLSAPSADRDDQDALIDALITATGGGGFDRQLILERVQAIFDPEGAGRALGPPRAAMTAESWVNQTEATLVGADTARSLSEEGFEVARRAHHETLAAYIAQQPTFARDLDIGDIFDSPTNDWAINNACNHITVTIGYLELQRRREEQTTQTQT